MDNKCGECTACCRVFAIKEFKKPAGKWCEHCAVGVGCRAYEARPPSCVDFACLWLLSQDRPQVERLGPELRPDRCKVVIAPTTDHTIIAFTALPGAWDAWRKPIFKTLIGRLVRGGLRAVMNTQVSTRKIIVDKYGERDIEMSEVDENGMQWSIPERGGETCG